MQLYQLKFPNGKSYIGITSKTAQERFKQHCKPLKNKSPCQHAINKYGKESVVITVLAECNEWELLCLAEIEAIEKFNTFYPNGYNLTLGGEGRLVVGIYGEERTIRDKQLNYERGKSYRDNNKTTVAADRKAYYESNKKAYAEKHKVYYELNKKLIKTKVKEHYEANKETAVARKKAWHEANKESIAAKKKSYRNTNKASILAKEKAYRNANKELIAARQKAIREAKKLQRDMQNVRN